YDLVIFVDAVKTGGKPGTLYVLEITAGDVETRGGNLTAKLSLHQTGVEEIIITAKAIGTLPRKVVVVGCEVERVELGEGLSKKVEEAIGNAVKLILEFLAGDKSAEN
ncbi:MAG TPA: hydrogenase maturation protease, partial [Methanomicrobia archaeon]|nr:hydrogenase maturation protease [Methanomicrobia archaeon]HEX58936.1 hydrogenase maturation protease [Methanomicrobia archaeon]